MRHWKCEFCEKWDFEIGEFCEKWDFQNVNFFDTSIDDFCPSVYNETFCEYFKHCDFLLSFWFRLLQRIAYFSKKTLLSAGARSGSKSNEKESKLMIWPSSALLFCPCLQYLRHTHEKYVRPFALEVTPNF